MPCYIYLRGDTDPIHCNEPPDVVLRRIEDTPAARFVPIEITPYAPDDTARTGYVWTSDVAAILPMDPRELEAELNDPPDWYSS